MKAPLLWLNWLALACVVAWLVFSPSWEAAAALLTLIASLLGVVRMKDKDQHHGIGGAAIKTEGAVDLHVENAGQIRGGRSGTGAGGGNAMHIAPGPRVKVRIINHGEIIGGDAATDGRAQQTVPADGPAPEPGR